MTVTAEQRIMRTLYCNLMAEAKLRLQIIGRTLNNEFKLPNQTTHELCYLQLRFVCETLALGCLAVHGDIPATRSGRMKSAYAADWIFKALGKLHPDFFPEPGIHIQHRDNTHEFFPSAEEYLTKNELLRLYSESGDLLHRGSMGRFGGKDFWPTPDFDKITKATMKMVLLLDSHRIKLFGCEDELLVSLNFQGSGKVQATLVRPG